MQIIIALIIVLGPIIPLIYVARWGTALINLQEKNIVIPNEVSPLNPINKNKEIIKAFFALEENTIVVDINEICRVIKNLQLGMIFYLSIGVAQLMASLIYPFWVLKSPMEIFALYNTNSQQLGMYIGASLFNFVGFWIFYGSNLFYYLGLEKAKKAIDSAIEKSFIIYRKLEEKITIFILSVIYLFLLLFYLYYLIPAINYLSVSYQITLIWVLILIFVFYYIAPKLIAFFYNIIYKNNKYMPKKQYVYEAIMNTTYLLLLILYVYGVAFNNSDNMLLQAIAILFLYDTYRTQKTKIQDSYQSKKSKDVS